MGFNNRKERNNKQRTTKSKPNQHETENSLLFPFSFSVLQDYRIQQRAHTVKTPTTHTPKKDNAPHALRLLLLLLPPVSGAISNATLPGGPNGAAAADAAILLGGPVASAAAMSSSTRRRTSVTKGRCRGSCWRIHLCLREFFVVGLVRSRMDGCVGRGLVYRAYS